MSSFSAVQSRNSPASVPRRADYQEAAQRPSPRIGLKVGAFIVGHAPLALLMQLSPNIGLLHASIVLVGGLWWITADRRSERAAYVCAYIVGAEVLWRMTKTPIF